MKTKHSLLTSCISLLLCFVMLLGTTFAWFTDVATSSGNVIKAGNLDIALMKGTPNGNGGWTWTENNGEAIFDYDNWEPGYTTWAALAVENHGNLAARWQAMLTLNGTPTILADVIEVYSTYDHLFDSTSRPDFGDGTWQKMGTVRELLDNDGMLISGDFIEPGHSQPIVIALHMREDAGNEYQDMDLGANFDIKIIATQASFENDSFGNDYDKDAQWPGTTGFETTASLNQVQTIYGELANDFIIRYSDTVYALLPAGTKLADGVDSLKFSGKSVENGSNITLGEGDSAKSYDIHIEGIADDNNVAITVYLGPILDKNISDTSLKLYHEDALMTRVNSVSEFGRANQYTYDAATGEVVLYVDNFSVFSGVITTADKWDGTSDTTWYNDETKNNAEFTLTTAEQLAGFRVLVDSGNTFAGKTVKLGADIDLANINFDPIGYGYNTVFSGTFDGANHTIYNLKQNGWELGYSYGTHGGGLFASIKDATIKNLAVSGANIVMECVDMGTVVGYAQGTCHFENIVVTNAKLANYQRYTGGVVGEVSGGSYGTDVSKGYSHTFNNVVVDSSVKISSLWGDFDNACGGVIGGKWGQATVKMENVTVACEIDAFSDVTAAYQWYAYRRCGILIGHTEQNSPKKALNAAAEFLTCENVNVYYGDWVKYTYYQFTNQTDKDGNALWYSNYPWVRAEAGEHNGALSNVRYGNPIINGQKINTIELAEANRSNKVTITFNQLYGGGQGVYGCNEHEGVTIYNNLTDAKTIYILNDQNLENLKLQYWFANGDDTWTTTIDGISMDKMKLSNFANVYRLVVPGYIDGFKIVANGEKEFEFTPTELENDGIYTLDGEAHKHNYDNTGKCTCGAYVPLAWEKLTNNGINIGDSIVFVYVSASASMELTEISTTSTKYGIGTKFTDTPAGTMVFEVVEGATEGTVAFKNGDKYLYWSSGNSLNTSNTLNENSSWTVSINASGIATVKNAADSTRIIQWNSGSPRFACYTSTQQGISIYKFVNGNAGVEPHNCLDHSTSVSCTENGKCEKCGKEIENTALGHDFSTNPYKCARENCEHVALPEAGSTITIEQALWIAETLANRKETSGKYTITGVIDDKDHPSSTGATTITADGKSIYITQIHNVDGTIRHDAFTTKLVNGDTITVSAKVAKNDGGEAQLRETWLTNHIDTNPIDHTCDICGATEISEHVDSNGDTVCDNGCDEAIETPAHTCENICKECRLCTNNECKESVCAAKCEGHSINTTISFANTAHRTSQTTSKQVWENGDVTLTNNKASSTSNVADYSNPARFYSGSSIVVQADGSNITKIVFDCNSGSYATALKNSIGTVSGATVSVSSDKVTVTFTSAVDNFTIAKLSAQVRMDSITVTYTK